VPASGLEHRLVRGPLASRSGTGIDIAGTPTGKVAVIIPAHNEEAVIADALASLQTQDRLPDAVVVVADNCTDRTAEIARAAGARVIETVGNEHKKAGALNQALTLVLDALDDRDAVLVMDADTTVAEDFIEVGLATLAENQRAGGVSSIFIGRQSSSFLGQLQRMEYFRYRREIRRFGNEAFVMSGTASLFRVAALRSVREARNGYQLPDGDGYYDVYSLTEDNELTFALKTLDYSCPAPGVTSTTDVMETPINLYRQRHRWYLGALRNLQNYGLKLPGHLRWVYWRQQFGLCLSVLSTLILLASTVVGLVLGASWQFSPVWLVPVMVVLVERVISVWPMGTRQRLIAALVVPELVYSMFLMLTFAVAAKDFVRGNKGTWHAT
jgi:cellulose synthase/poly-beta-1,6-N-acetylglucosamine synthase-like glycosyltransferase